MDIAVANDIWSRLAEEGKAPTDPHLASETLGAFTVGIEPWIDRLARTYLQGLCRRAAHSKLVIGEYGGGKTHFLMSLASRAHQENYAFAYIECAQGVSLASPFDLYRAAVKSLLLPGEEKPGLAALARRIVAHKKQQIRASGAPDVDAAFGFWLEDVVADEYPEPSFGRVIAELLRATHDPESGANKDAALRWLRGEEGHSADELIALRLARVPKNRLAEFGRNMLISLLQFVRHAGVHGTLLLFDEVETLFNARGKALDQVLGAMRVFIDIPTGVPGGVPILTVFAAVPQIHGSLERYPALNQRLAVLGSTFQEGNDRAPQIDLGQLGSDEGLLRDLGTKLLGIGEAALGHTFDRQLQLANLQTLVRAAVRRNMDIDRRRLFIKTWTSLLDQQVNGGERLLDEEEVRNRYSGAFDALRHRDEGRVAEEV